MFKQEDESQIVVPSAMNTSRKGDETEAAILSRLMELGLSVSVPFGDSDRYDLVVDDGRCLYRVQCKTGSWVNGAIRFNLYTSTVNSEGASIRTTLRTISTYMRCTHGERTKSTGYPSKTPETARCGCEWTTPIRKHRYRRSTGLANTGFRGRLDDRWKSKCVEVSSPCHSLPRDDEIDTP